MPTTQVLEVAQRWAREYIGKEATVRVDKNTRWHGKVIECEVIEFEDRPWGWAVTLELPTGRKFRYTTRCIPP